MNQLFPQKVDSRRNHGYVRRDRHFQEGRHDGLTNDFFLSLIFDCQFCSPAFIVDECV